MHKINKSLKKTGWAMVAHAFNPSNWEAEAGRFLSSRPAWSTQRNPQKTNKQKQKNTKRSA
jgi:major histocompatibility complex class I